MQGDGERSLSGRNSIRQKPPQQISVLEGQQSSNRHQNAWKWWPQIAADRQQAGHVTEEYKHGLSAHRPPKSIILPVLGAKGAWSIDSCPDDSTELSRKGKKNRPSMQWCSSGGISQSPGKRSLFPKLTDSRQLQLWVTAQRKANYKSLSFFFFFSLHSPQSKMTFSRALYHLFRSTTADFESEHAFQLCLK